VSCESSLCKKKKQAMDAGSGAGEQQQTQQQQQKEAENQAQSPLENDENLSKPPSYEEDGRVVKNGGKEGGDSGSEKELVGTEIVGKMCGCFPRAAWFSDSYALDYIGIVLCTLIIIVFNSAVDWLNEQPINMADISIQEPLFEDTVNMAVVGGLVVVPNALAAFFFWFRRRDAFEDMHAYLLAVVTPIVFAYVIWVIIGNTVGEPRPDLLARCAPSCMENITWTCVPDLNLYKGDCDLEEQKCCPIQCGIKDPRYPEVIDCTFVQNGQNISGVEEACIMFWNRYIPVNEAQCNGLRGDSSYNEFSIREGFKSMPSGHTQVVFNSATTWFLYLAGKLQLYGFGVQQRTFAYSYIMASLLFAVATYVGVTRLNDQKHFIFDVVLGALIGIFTSLLAYPLYYQDPRIGGEPLRRPQGITFLDSLCCRANSMQFPWPAANTHLPKEDYPSSSAFAKNSNADGDDENGRLLDLSQV